MNTWFGSFFFAIVALTLGSAQDFEMDSDRLFLEGMAKRRTAELFGKRDGLAVPGFGREVRRTRELFGKRQAYPMPSIHHLRPSTDMEQPAKRRTRELFGKRSAELSPLTSEQMEMLTTMLMDRPRRRGGELFGR